MTIAHKCREIGAGPGSIIEIGYRSDEIDRILGDGIGEEVPGMFGWVLEVTAVGEASILAHRLLGANADFKTTYGSITWVRDAFGESRFCSCSILNKVGQKTAAGIEWSEPDLDCIYTRLQK